MGALTFVVGGSAGSVTHRSTAVVADTPSQTVPTTPTVPSAAPTMKATPYQGGGWNGMGVFKGGDWPGS